MEDEEEETGLKAKFMSLISGFKKKSDDADEESEDEESEDEDEDEDDRTSDRFSGIINRLPFLSAVLNKSSKNDDDNDDDSVVDSKRSSKGKKKKKFELKIIHVLLIIGVLVLLLFNDEPENIKPELPVKALSKQTQKPQEAQKQPEPVPEPVLEPKLAEEVVAPPTVEVPDPIEEIPEATVETVEEAKSIEDSNENSAATSLEENIEEAEPPSEEIAAVVTDPLESTVGQDPSQSGVEAQKIDDTISVPEDGANDKMTDLTEKLLGGLEERLKEEKREQDLVEVLKAVSAPSYEARGPSLVYNCSGQHWACVEPKFYKECRQNYSWNKKNNLPIECYPFAEMDDNFDCATVQQEKIDTIGKTNFCK